MQLKFLVLMLIFTSINIYAKENKVMTYLCANELSITTDNLEDTCFDVKLDTGLEIKKIRIRTKQVFLDKSLILIRGQGLEIFFNGNKIDSINESDFEKTIDLLLEQKDVKYGDIDSIDLDLGLINPVWLNVKEKLLETKNKYDYEVLDSTTKNLTQTVSRALNNDEIIHKICSKFVVLGKKCKSKNIVDINPIPFEGDLIFKRWKDAKQRANLGIKKEIMWYGIYFE